MPGSITSNPGSVPLARPSAILTVERMSGSGESADYELLPNVRCLQVDQPKEDGDPGSARFRYAFGDPLGDPDDPQRLEDVFGFDANGQHVVQQDDHLVVRAYREDGYSEILFDGFVLTPQGDLAPPETESVTFVAIGTPAREFDTPLAGAVVRGADEPDTAGNDVETDLPARFNPDGKPNASPDGADSGEGTNQYPVFLGPFWPSNEINGQTVRMWTLGMAARYIVAQGNPDEKYVKVDDLSYLDTVLQAPKGSGDDNGAIDFDDAPEMEDIECQDIDVTGTAWPMALTRLIGPHGFGWRFVLSDDGDGNPEWGFGVYRKDDNKSVKSLMLQQVGDDLDPGNSNVSSLRLSRDTHNLANQIAIDAAPTRYEASFVLAPLFPISPDDAASASAIKNFSATDPSQASQGGQNDAYRLYGFDECGEGHWVFGSSTSTSIADLSPVLNPDDDDPPPFVIKRRPPTNHGKLLTVDANKKPFPARLMISTDYSGESPAVWDGSGTWQRCYGGWELARDRLGIRITCSNPNGWNITPPSAPGQPIPAQIVKGVESQALAGGTHFFLMLTCCIDADQDSNIVAKKRAASPTEFTITRRVDARYRFKKWVISQYSFFNSGTEDVDAENDDDDAQAHADAVRRADEAGVFAGNVVIPRLSTAYNIGDKVDEITGRGISLQQNAANESGESPIYPAIVGITWDFDGRQATILELSDERAQPPPKRAKGYIKDVV